MKEYRDKNKEKMREFYRDNYNKKKDNEEFKEKNKIRLKEHRANVKAKLEKLKELEKSENN
jgi:hypothetical protein